MKIIEYKLIEDYNISSVEKAVNTMIQDGFQPLGNVVIRDANGSIGFVQCMVKYDGDNISDTIE